MGRKHVSCSEEEEEEEEYPKLLFFHKLEGFLVIVVQ